MGIPNIRMGMTGICEGGAYTTGTNVAIMCASFD